MEELLKILFDSETGEFTIEMNADFIEHFYYNAEDIQEHLDYSSLNTFKDNFVEALKKGKKHQDTLKNLQVTDKKFRFKKNFRTTSAKLQIGEELPIEVIDGVEYVMDDVYAIFETNSDMAKEYGEVINQ